MVQVYFKLIKKAGLDLLTSSSISILIDENWGIEAWNSLKVRFISVSYVMLIKTGIRLSGHLGWLSTRDKIKRGL